MHQTVVITGAGRDRVGIVAELTTVLFKLGCNLLDSSMTLLRGEFAIILMTSLGDGVTLDHLTKELQGVQDRLDLHLQIRELSKEQLHASLDGNERNCIISVYGADRPGIVSGITNKLATLKANITDVETTRTTDLSKDATQSVFIMILEAKIPGSVSLDDVRSELKETAAALGVDVTVQELETVEL